MTKYKVKFQYHQYNSGQADNGDYTGNITCDTLKEAQQLVKAFRKAAEFHIKQCAGENWTDIKPANVQYLIDTYIPYDGYFKGEPQIFEVTEQELINLQQHNNLSS